MLSYRHAFHAGNHADIIKHISLIQVLESMRKKEKPFTAIDCNAGAGFYYLDDERALKTGESSGGIMRLLSLYDADSSVLSDFVCTPVENYIKFIKQYTDRGIYPGSPEIIRSFLRETDHAILMELHNNEIEILKSRIIDSKISIHHRDCFEGLKALTPPPVKRGFLLMDPSYEDDSDYINVASSLCEVQKRWNVGVICLWYPLLKHRKTDLEMMIDKIQNCASNNGLESFTSEFLVDSPDREAGLYGSGMLFVNPPWKLKDELDYTISCLNRVFNGQAL